jgi:hypothetical protein
VSDILFLDDDPARQKKFRSNNPSAAIVSTAKACIEALQLQAWDIVHLDHDLDGTYNDPAGENTGSEVVRWIFANKPIVGRFVVHTYNEHVWKDMLKVLKQAGYKARYVPFKMYDEPPRRLGEAF